MSILLCSVISSLAFVVAWGLGYRRGRRRNLQLFSSTVYVIREMIKTGEIDKAKEFIDQLLHSPR